MRHLGRDVVVGRPGNVGDASLGGQGPANASSQLLEEVINAQVQLDHPKVVIHLLTDPRLDDQHLGVLRLHPSIAAIKRTNASGVEEDITTHQKLLSGRLIGLPALSSGGTAPKEVR